MTFYLKMIFYYSYNIHGQMYIFCIYILFYGNYRDGGLMDQVLERQADMIRYLKQHNEQLSKKILVLSEENKSLRQRTQTEAT